MNPDQLIAKSSANLPGTAQQAIKAPKGLFPVDPPEISELRRKFEESRDLTADSRRDQKRDRDYYDGPGQLSSEVRATLRQRGQPAIYLNHVKPAVNGVLGVLIAGQTDPRAYPRNPQDQNSADVATKALRYIADSARYDGVKIDCAEDFLTRGLCATVIEGTADTVTVKQIRWDEFFYDPRSRRPDFKDADYLGFAKWMYASDVKALFPAAYAALGDPVESGYGGAPGGEQDDLFGDKPSNAGAWVCRASRRLLVVTLYYKRAGGWYRCVYCSSGALDHDLTGYTDAKGRQQCPVEAASCYVDGDNNRYGIVRDMVCVQDEINARRSRLLHLSNSRQIQQNGNDNGVPVDADVARAEAVRADGVIPPGWQMVPTADLANGQAALLQESKAEMTRLGPTPAVLGRSEGGNQSGRARLVSQQAGLTELALPLSRLEDWEQRCYQQMFSRAQQFWRAPMWIRVTDSEDSLKFVQLNEPVLDPATGQPVYKLDPATGMPLMQAVAGPDGQPVVDPATGQPAARPVQETRNRLAEMDMDVLVRTTPDSANLQAEVFNDLKDLVGGGLDPFSPQFELLLEMSPLADKQRVRELIKAKRGEQEQANAAQAAAQAQQAQAAAAIGEATAAADLEVKKAKAALDTAKALKETSLRHENELDVEQRIGATPMETSNTPVALPAGLSYEA